MLAPNNELKSIGPWVKGEIVDYVERHVAKREPVEKQRWHVVQVEPQQETSVCESLDDLGLSSFCPREPRKVRASAVRHHTIMRPMLVGYLFAGFDPQGDLWWNICGIRGVRRLMMINFRPVPIPEPVIVHLRNKERDLAAPSRRGQPIALDLGMLVRILEPFAFAGLFGHVTKIDEDHQLVEVDVDIFGRMVPVPLRPDQVETV